MIKWFIDRPVSLFCVYSIIFLLGIISVLKIPVEYYPDVTYPVINITFYLSNASPETMERYVTQKVKGAVYKLDGIKSVKTYSYRGGCSIEATFERGTDMTYQRILLSETVGKLKLPKRISKPYVSEIIPNEIDKGHNYILYLSGPYSRKELGKYAEKLRAELSKVYGIRSIELGGILKPMLRIKLKSDEYSPSLISSKLMQNKFVAGMVNVSGRNMTVMCKRYNNIGDILIDGIPLKKIANIHMIYKEPDVINKINGKPQITINIDKQKGYNILELDKKIKRVISGFDLKKGMKIKIARDDADNIKKTIRNILLLGIIGILGVAIILFLFFRKYYIVFIFFLSILFSVLLTFSLFYFSKLSINALTMAGLALGFGMLVDNSIIVLENVMRMKENKIQNPELNGAKDVSLAIIASTLTTISVYVPFLYFQNSLRIYYKQFALSSAFALLSSIFVSLTLIPSLSRNITSAAEKNSLMFKAVLKRIIKFKWVVLAFFLLLFAASVYIFNYFVVKGNVLFFQSRNEIYVGIELPQGAQSKNLNSIVSEFEKIIGTDNDVKAFYTTIYKNNANIDIVFKKGNKSNFYNLKSYLENLSANYSNLRILILGAGEPFFISSGGDKSVAQMTLSGYNYFQLEEISQKIARELGENGRVQDVDYNFSWYSKQKEYILARRKDSPVSSSIKNYDIVEKIIPKRIIYKNVNNKVLPIEIYTDSILSVKSLLDKRINENFYIREMANLSIKDIPFEIQSKNHEYRMNIGYTFRGPYQMAEDFKLSFLKSVNLPAGFKLEDYKWHEEKVGLSKKTILISIILSLFLLIAILSSLYESVGKSFIIILILPFSFIGIVLVYYLTKTSFDSSAFVGVILFSGIAVNDGIVLIDHLSKGKKQNLDEIAERSSHRVRPVIITSLTTIIALIPFLFLKSQGIMFSKLSLSTIGGLTFSTIGSLILIPIVYYMMFGRKM